MGPDSITAGGAAVPGDPEVVLRVERLSKTFPGTRALDDVSLEVRRGEVHALVGNNGSGKSTLIKILAGVCSADPGGEITIGARRFSAARFSAAEARSSGLHFVHQVPVLFPALSVAENLAIGRGFEVGRPWRIRWREQRERARHLIGRFHIRAVPETPVAALGPVEQTLIAIARALQDQENEREGVLVLDEPSASLPGPEVDRLLETLRRYAASGRSIVYVTHRLEEVLRATDRVTALRDGRRVGTVDTSTMDEAKLVSFMLGRTPSSTVLPDLAETMSSKATARSTESFLSARGLSGGRVASATFDLARGEIVGIAGLVGSGASDLLQLLFGVLPIRSGEVALDGKPLRPANPREAVALGIAYVPAERAANASFHAMSVRANWSAAGVRRYFRGLRLRHGVERADALAAIRRFAVRAASDEQPFSTLSGGNQQKVVLARWLHDKPRLLLLDEPTQGVDVHARAEIHQALRETTRRGTLAVVVGSDFQELARLCDRVLVMVEGRVVAEARPPSLDAHRLSELAHFASQDAPQDAPQDPS
jgi:ribose transport system ATP-binding protein